MPVILGDLLGGDVVIVVVVLLIFGFLGPRIARNLGAAKKEFEKSTKSDAAAAKDETPSDQ